MRKVEHPVSRWVVLQRIERCAEQGFRSEEIRPQTYGLFQRIAGVCKSLQTEVGQAEIVVNLERLRIQLRGTSQRLDGFLVLPVLAIQHAERGELVGIVRIEKPVADVAGAAAGFGPHGLHASN